MQHRATSLTQVLARVVAACAVIWTLLWVALPVSGQQRWTAEDLEVALAIAIDQMTVVDVESRDPVAGGEVETPADGFAMTGFGAATFLIEGPELVTLLGEGTLGGGLDVLAPGSAEFFENVTQVGVTVVGTNESTAGCSQYRDVTVYTQQLGRAQFRAEFLEDPGAGSSDLTRLACVSGQQEIGYGQAQDDGIGVDFENPNPTLQTRVDGKIVTVVFSVDATASTSAAIATTDGVGTIRFQAVEAVSFDPDQAVTLSDITVAQSDDTIRAIYEQLQTGSGPTPVAPSPGQQPEVPDEQPEQGRPEDGSTPSGDLPDERSIADSDSDSDFVVIVVPAVIVATILAVGLLAYRRRSKPNEPAVGEHSGSAAPIAGAIGMPIGPVIDPCAKERQALKDAQLAFELTTEIAEDELEDLKRVQSNAPEPPDAKPRTAAWDPYIEWRDVTLAPALESLNIAAKYRNEAELALREAEVALAHCEKTAPPPPPTEPLPDIETWTGGARPVLAPVGHTAFKIRMLAGVGAGLFLGASNYQFEIQDPDGGASVYTFTGAGGVAGAKAGVYGPGEWTEFTTTQPMDVHQFEGWGQIRGASVAVGVIGASAADMWFFCGDDSLPMQHAFGIGFGTGVGLGAEWTHGYWWLRD